MQEGGGGGGGGGSGQVDDNCNIKLILLVSPNDIVLPR